MTIADDLKTIAILDRMTDLIQEGWTMKHAGIGDVAGTLCHAGEAGMSLVNGALAGWFACYPTDECESCGCSLSSHTFEELVGCGEFDGPEQVR